MKQYSAKERARPLLSWFVDRTVRKVGFLINKNISGNIGEFCEINDRVASLVNKHNKRYKFKVVLTHMPASSHDSQQAHSFYECAQSAVKKVKALHPALTGSFKIKVGKKQAGVQAVAEYDISPRNGRGELS